MDFNGGASRSRTEVGGFAIRSMATLPTRLRMGADNNIESFGRQDKIGWNFSS